MVTQPPLLCGAGNECRRKSGDAVRGSRVNGRRFIPDSDKLHRSTERDTRRAHYYALFWGLGLRVGYLATSGAKSDVIFLLGDPDFLVIEIPILR